MIDMNSIKSLQTQFDNIGDRRVVINENKDGQEGVAFGRCARFKQTTTDGNKSVMSAVLDKLREAGADLEVENEAKKLLGKAGEGKSVRGREVSQALGKLMQYATNLEKAKAVQVAGIRATNTFERNIENALAKVGTARGFKSLQSSEEQLSQLKTMYTNTCKDKALAGTPVTKEETAKMLVNLAHMAADTANRKTHISACTTLRTPPKGGGNSPSESLFFEIAKERGINAPLDTKARNTLNNLFREKVNPQLYGPQGKAPQEEFFDNNLEATINDYLTKYAETHPNATKGVAEATGQNEASSEENVDTVFSTAIQQPLPEEEEKKGEDIGTEVFSTVKRPSVPQEDDKAVDDGKMKEPLSEKKPSSSTVSPSVTESLPNQEAENVSDEATTVSPTVIQPPKKEAEELSDEATTVSPSVTQSPAKEAEELSDEATTVSPTVTQPPKKEAEDVSGTTATVPPTVGQPLPHQEFNIFEVGEDIDDLEGLDDIEDVDDLDIDFSDLLDEQEEQLEAGHAKMNKDFQAYTSLLDKFNASKTTPAEDAELQAFMQ